MRPGASHTLRLRFTAILGRACARSALGVHCRAKREAMFSAAGLFTTQEVWNMSIISFWDRMIRLPNGRLGKDIMADAVKDADNPFTKKLIAAMEAVFGQSPDLSVAMSGRHKFKAHLAAAQRARQYAAWTAHTSKHKANGGGPTTHRPSQQSRTPAALV